MRMLKKIEPEIPIFHAREMRQKFQKEVALISSSNIKPHMLRHMVSGHYPTGYFPEGTSPTDCSPMDTYPKDRSPTGQ